MMKYILLIFPFLISLLSFSQQAPLSNFYLVNEYLLNPAEIGDEESFNAFLSLRQQWVGIEGAPNTAYINASSRVTDKIYIGASLSRDKIHFYEQINALFTVDYKLQINKTQFLNFAFSPGVFNNQINTKLATVENENDILFNQDLNGISFNSNVGFKYHINLKNSNVLSMGTSANNLFSNDVKLTLNDDLTSDYYTLNRSANIYMSYEFNNVPRWKFSPLFLVRFSENTEDLQYDINLLATYNNFIWSGLMYRSEDGIALSLGVNINDYFIAGYSYGLGLEGISSTSRGTHEVSIGYKFNKKIKTVKKIDTVEIIKNIYKTDTVFINDTIINTDTIIQIDSIIVPQKIGKEEVNFKVVVGMHIVYGSYAVKENAEKELYRLKSKGYKPEIIVSESGQYQRIVLGSYTNDSETLLKVSEFKQDGFKDVWIWRVKKM